jgi:hypothetical protein
MQVDDIEPLEPGHWMRRIRQLATWPLDDDANLERALRHAFHLVQLTPRPLRHIIHCTSGEVEFEALLQTRAFEAAVFRLVGNRTPYNLSKSSDELGVTAEVWYPDQYSRCSATDRSAPLALFRAWLECNTAIGETVEPGRSAGAVDTTPKGTCTEH